MNKRIFTILTVLFMVLVALQFAAPVAAVKVVDKGTIYGWSGQNGWMKITWKTYQWNNNFLKCYAKYYVKVPGSKKYVYSWRDTITIAKVTKSSVKITDWTDSELCPGTSVTYAKTKLTAARYYWRVYRYNIIGGLKHVHK